MKIYFEGLSGSRVQEIKTGLKGVVEGDTGSVQGKVRSYSIKFDFEKSNRNVIPENLEIIT